MAAGMFRVGVTVFAIDRASAAMVGIMRAISSTTTASRALRAELAGIQTGIMVGGGMMAVGGAMAAGLGKAVQAAAALQIQMKALQLTTQASHAEMNDFLNTAIKTSDRTMFSLTQVTAIAKSMATMGIGLGGNSPLNSIERVNRLLPMFAQAAEILYQLRDVAPEQTVHLFGGVAHMLGQYNPSQLQTVGEALIKGAMVMPSRPTSMLTMASYIVPFASRILGISGPDLISLMVASQMTAGGGQGGGRFGGLSGAQWLNVMTRSMPGVFGSGLFTGQSGAALSALGLTHGAVSAFIDPKKNRFDLFGLFGALGKVMEQTETLTGQREILERLIRTHQKRAIEFAAPLLQKVNAGVSVGPALATTLFQWSFGAGGRTAAMAGTQSFQQLIKQVNEYIRGHMTVSQIQTELMLTANDQWSRLVTNLGSVQTLFGYGVLPGLTRFTQKLADATTKLAVLEFRNPEATKRVFEGASALAAGFIGTGGWMVMVKVMQVLGMIGEAAGTAEVLGALVSFVTGVGEIAVPLYLVMTNWSKLAEVLRGYPNINAILTNPLASLEGALKRLEGLGHWVGGALNAPTMPSNFPGDKRSSILDMLKMIGAADLTVMNALIGHLIGGPASPAKKPSAYFTHPGEPAAGLHPVNLTINTTVNGAAGADIHRLAERIAEENVRRLHGALLSVTTGMGRLEPSVLHTAEL